MSGLPASVARRNYEAAAILLDEMIAGAGNVAEYQYALWDLFTSTAPTYGNSTALVNGALAYVTNPLYADSGMYQRLEIYTPADSPNQELLRLRPPPATFDAVPEPGTLCLAGGALLLLGTASRRRRKRGTMGRPASCASTPAKPG